MIFPFPQHFILVTCIQLVCESCISEHEMVLVMYETKTVFWTKIYTRFCVKYCSILGHQNFFSLFAVYPRPFCSTGLYFAVLVPTQLPPQQFSVPVRHSQVDWCFIQHFGLPFLLRLMRTWHRSQLCTQPFCTPLSTSATLTFSFFFFCCLPSYPSLCGSPNLILLLSFLFNFY